MAGDSLSRFLPGLRSQSSTIRHRAARDLRKFIESESRDLSHALYMKWVTDISSRLMDLCNSNDTYDRMGGIAAMDELVELFIAERNDQTIIEFAHSLTKVFEKIPSADAVTLRLASKALGHIVSTGGTSLIEFVEDYHVRPALEWLKNETFHVRRHAAVMILKELSVNAPSTSFRYMDRYFDFIWSAFWDARLVVRVSASESLQTCFSLIQQRESNRKSSWYMRALDEAESAFRKNTSDATHGSLLIINELLRNTGDFMHPHYGRVCELVFNYREHKSATVRSAVVNLFPRLAKFNTSAFVEKFYRPCMRHLLEVLFSATTTIRSDALLSIGKLSLAIGPSLARDEQTLSSIMTGIKVGLQVKKKDFDTHREALACLRMLAEAVGPGLVRVDIESMVTPLFQNDLDSPLVETLATIVKKIPAHRQIIQQKLFERLSSILSVSRLGDGGGSAATTSSRVRPKTSSMSVTSGNLLSIFSSAINQTKANMNMMGAGSSDMSGMSSTVMDVNSAIAMQALALETLATFDFQGNRHIPIMQFVHETVVKFLDHEVAAIRKSAATTCCKLLLPPGEERGAALTSEDFSSPVTAVLERLLTVGIADTEASIRLQVLASLDTRFDPLLAENDNLRCLFIALNDEVFEIRQKAMSMLGRLTHHNPSAVLPSLRQTLVQLLAELEFSGDTRGKEEGALLIGCLLRSAAQLAKPYVLPILKALMKNLREDSARRSHSRSTVTVSKAILATLGDLAEVGAQELTPFLSQLLPEVIDEMRDSSNPQILQVAIKTLGQLVSSTGYVVLPYHEYPELLDLLCEALQKSGDANEPLRIEAGRTLGIIGALDPYNLRLFHLQKQGKLTKAPTKEFRNGTLGAAAGTNMNATAVGTNVADASMANGNVAGTVNFAGVAATGANGVSHFPTWVGDEDSKIDVPLLLSEPRKEAQKDKQSSGTLSNVHLEAPPDDILPSMIEGDSAQYFPTVAVNALIRILLEPRNSVHYQGTFVAIMYICKSQRKRIAAHLDKIIPAFLYTMEKVNRSLRKFLFEQLCDLVQIVEEQIQPHLDHVAMLSIVHSYWDEHLEEVLNLVKKLANSLGESFRVYLPDLIPQLLRVIRTERDNPSRPRTLLVLKTSVSLGRLLDGYLHLIIPALVALIQSVDADLNARKQGLGSLGSLVKKLNVSVYASKIIHMLARVISSQHELVYLAMDCLCCMVYTMGDDYAIFVPVISQVLGRQTSRNNDIFDRYDLLVSKILKHQPLPVASWATDPLKARIDPSVDQKDANAAAQEETKSLPCDQKNLMKAWEASQRGTKEDWTEWMRAFSVELLRESPSPVLRACKELASVYQPLAQELFNASFVSVWPHLSSPTQDNLIRALETAFQSSHLPSEILQTLLNLAEFMEHDDQPLPIDIRLLGSLAEKCHSFAKALHYKELEFNTNPSADGIQALISINSKLNQPEAARGILKHAMDLLPGIEVKASWHEKLLRWDDALATHDRVLKEQPDNVEAIFGKMRCLYAIGEWRKLNDHVQETWSKIYGEDRDPNSEQGGGKLLDVPPALKKELCSNGARVAFSLQNWDAIPKYINSDMDETESHLFQAVVAIRRMELEEALSSIYQCRKVMDPTLRSLVSESYSRAYLPSIVNLQMLTELEEIVAYLKTFAYKNHGELTLLSVPSSSTTSRRKQSISSLNFVSSSSSTSYGHEKQAALAKLQTIWTRRVLGVERNIQVWQSLMLVRSLVFDPREDVDIWLKFSRLCRKSGHINLAAGALWRVGAQPFIRSVQKDPNHPLPINFGNGAVSGHGFANGIGSLADGSTPDARVAFSYLRHLWAENKEDIALKQITHFIEALEQHGDVKNEEMVKLRVQVYIQLGEWQMSLLEPRKQADGVFDQVLGCLETATQLDPTNHRAWHEWALMNFRALEATVKDQNDPNQVKRYAAPSIQGFFRSISFGHTRYDVTKDVLRLLTLWFAHGQRNDVHAAMSEGFQDVSIDTWLDVIPQLIARIDSPNPKMNELLHELLSRIGLAHPQALIYPITVASKALNPKRKLAAEGILAAVRRHSSKLVYEADMVSRELIRVAILWNELWHGALEEASKHYFNNRDTTAMIAELAPLHELMDKIGTEEAPTLREVAFYQAFARDLKHAKEWTNVFEKTRSIDDLNQAWDIYYSVFSRIRKQLANLSTLELANVGPKLLSVHSLSLAVPGTYKAGAPIVRIQSFDNKVTVLTSKQRPRKVTINGSDGKAYPFLLKGHEDLRQDERVMQLFGVINTLLANDSDTSKRNLAIERYSVLPLSHTSGLIGWVPFCDTLHQLIRDYREARKIQLNVEHRLMVQMAPDYDKLPLMQKVEAFKYALGETTGQDLYRVLWLKSQDSEVWLDRRRNFTRSLAVMSMAGYILGLGDRHPSNLMLDRVSGKLVHIDFGDCFEVAMERDKYPEKIPFRLTRMLTQAMEVSGIEGNFRYTCEASMRVLRDNRDSLMAVLEAFVYDPLINWRLLKKDAVPSHAQPEEDTGRADANEVNESNPRSESDAGAGGAPEDEKLIVGSVKSTSSASVTPTRRRHSSESMFGFNMDPLDAASLSRNSIKEAQLDYDSKNIGQSVITTEFPQLNEKALSVIDRVKKKLVGRDFDDGSKVLSVDAQVDRLIMQATSHENLCQLYYGWCPFW
ncbi:Phosphatidylinositol kinase, partial [Globisporangium splendens]